MHWSDLVIITCIALVTLVYAIRNFMNKHRND